MPLALAAVEYGAGPPLAILHGLFGSGRNWTSIAQGLAPQHRVIALDLRNHGASPWAETVGCGEMAEDVRASLRARGYEHYALLGHSMGGKVAMMAALQHPEMVERLIVADIAPVSYPMRHLCEVEAMRRLDLTGIQRRSQADVALAAAIPDAAERAFLLQNLIFNNGGARWRLNLEAIEQGMPALVEFPAIPAGRTYDGPALFLAGGRSLSSPAITPRCGRAFMPRPGLRSIFSPARPAGRRRPIPCASWPKDARNSGLAGPSWRSAPRRACRFCCWLPFFSTAARPCITGPMRISAHPRLSAKRKWRGSRRAIFSAWNSPLRCAPRASTQQRSDRRRSSRGRPSGS